MFPRYHLETLVLCTPREISFPPQQGCNSIFAGTESIFLESSCLFSFSQIRAIINTPSFTGTYETNEKHDVPAMDHFFDLDRRFHGVPSPSLPVYNNTDELSTIPDEQLAEFFNRFR